MKTSFFLLLALLGSAFAAINLSALNQQIAEIKKTPLGRTNPDLIDRIVKKVRERGCNVNLCFALDGSGSVGDDFETQRTFVQLITAIVGADPRNAFAGTVYGTINQNISPLTKNAEKFLLRVTNAPFPGAFTTFISAGLGFCFNELDEKFAQKKDVNKIVLLGDGLSNFGDLTGPLAPVSIAQQWRDLGPNNFLCAVAVGFPSIRALEDITGSRDLVLEVTEWIKLLNILDDLVDKICFRQTVIDGQPAKGPCPCDCISVRKKGILDSGRALKKANRSCRGLKKLGCTVTECGPSSWHCCA